MEFRILGPLEVRDRDRRVHVGGRNRRALLAVLLLHANELFSTDRLIDELYGEQPPRTATQSVHNAVSQLRRALGRDVLETHPTGYVLHVEPEAFDLARFEGLVARARETSGEERAAFLHEALGLWRGGALADLADEPFAQTEILRLEETRLAALEERIEADLALGRHAEVVGELEALVARNPLRERLRRQLMLALYRSGRQADALAAYQHARRVLVEDLGLEPSEELQELERSILQQDASLRAPAPIAPPPAVPAGRRKTVTVLFTDLVDSTPLGEQLDPEALHDVLSRYFAQVRTVLERHGGTIEKFIGDAVAAVFGVPVAHEDDALRAVRAAVEMRSGLDTLNQEFERELGIRLRARTGVNTGETFTAGGDSQGSLVTGDPGNVAARLEQSSSAGEILIGEATYRLVRDAVTVEPLEPLELKGKRAPVTVYRLLAVEPRAPGRARRFDTPMVGRALELEGLCEAFEAALADRACRLLTVLGPAGVGKSRLVREFLARLGSEARVLHGRCLPYGEGISFWPVIEAVKHAADVTEDTPADEARARVEALVAGEDAERLVATRLAQLLGLDEGTASSDELTWAARRLFEALARRRPLVLVLDDVHWGEPAFLDLVEHLARAAGEAPILLLCLAREELLEIRDWGALPGATAIRLAPLTDDESRLLVQNLLGAGVANEAQARIGAAAEGNPLYAEELVAMLIDEGLLRREDARWVPSGDLTSLAMPPTVGALLSARLDGLPGAERSALEGASIEGQLFHAGALAELLPEPERQGLSRTLTALVHKDLVRPERASFASEEAFRFRHLLIRDAAYAAMPKRRRGELHERFASWLEERAGDRLPELEAIVGYHLEQAYSYGAEFGRADKRLAQAAGQRLASAGLQAAKRGDDPAKRGDDPAVVNLLGRAISLLPPGAEASADLRCELGLALRRVGRLAEGEKAFEEALRASKDAGDARGEHRARIELACSALLRDPRRQADAVLALASRAIPVFADAGDARSLARAWSATGFVHMFRGRNAAWEAAEERSWAHLQNAGWSPSGAWGDIASAAFQGPKPVRVVVSRYTELLDEIVGHPRAEAGVLVFLGCSNAMLGRFDEARRHIRRARSLYEELGDRLHLARACAALSGQIETLAGDLAASERDWREGFDILEEMGDVSFLASHAAELADVLCAQCRYDEADVYSQLAKERAAADDVYTQVLWRIARSKIVARQNERTQAELLAQEAVDRSSETDALVLIGRAHLALTEVLRLDGRLDEAKAAAHDALVMFKRKGDVVSTRNTRALLRELESESESLAELPGR